MKKDGKIIEILDKNLVKVEIIRTSACGESCQSCGGCPIKSSTIIAENEDNCGINDEVCLEINNDKFFYLSFAIFIFPILSIIFAYILLRNFIPNDDFAAISAFLMGVAVFVAVVMFSKKVKMPKCYKSSNNL